MKSRLMIEKFMLKQNKRRCLENTHTKATDVGWYRNSIQIGYFENTEFFFQIYKIVNITLQ